MNLKDWNFWEHRINSISENHIRAIYLLKFTLFLIHFTEASCLTHTHTHSFIPAQRNRLIFLLSGILIFFFVFCHCLWRILFLFTLKIQMFMCIYIFIEFYCFFCVQMWAACHSQNQEANNSTSKYQCLFMLFHFPKNC